MNEENLNKIEFKMGNIEVFEDINGESLRMELIEENIKKMRDFFNSIEVFDVKVKTTAGTEIHDDGTVNANIEVGLSIKEEAGIILERLLEVGYMVDDYKRYSERLKIEEEELKREEGVLNE